MSSKARSSIVLLSSFAALLGAVSTTAVLARDQIQIVG
jgi:hypothetical protein